MEVLLAKTFDPNKHDPTGWWMSEKLDGVRAVWTGVRMLSRNGKEIMLPPEWIVHLQGVPVLDGELHLGRGRFQELVSIVRRKEPDARWADVQYHVFDGPNLNGPFEKRWRFLRDHWLRNIDFIRLVEHTECHGMPHLQWWYENMLELGAEGVMLRQPYSLYEARRSGTLLKYKPEIDGTATVVGVEPGKGKYRGMVGSLLVQDDDHAGVLFGVGTGLSDDERRQDWPAGTKIRWRAQERTLDGIPRFPRFVCIHEGD